MSRSTPRAVAYLALALTSFSLAGSAEAAVGGLGAAALSSFAQLSPVQTVQSGECWEQNGPDGPGYYPCGDGFGGGGSIIGPAIGLHRRHGVVVAHPHEANRGYFGASSGRVGAGSGVPAAHLRGVGGSALGAAGVRAAGVQRRAAPVSPGLAGVHGPDEATEAHVAAPASPGLAGVHAPGGAALPHISAPASPGVAGGAGAAPNIGAPVSPNLAGVHGASVAAVPHVAPASPGLAGVHGVGGGGGIGHH
jgi:hypothetical protein